jgi:hypothetical protein
MMWIGRVGQSLAADASIARLSATAPVARLTRSVFIIGIVLPLHRRH